MIIYQIRSRRLVSLSRGNVYYVPCVGSFSESYKKPMKVGYDAILTFGGIQRKYGVAF